MSYAFNTETLYEKTDAGLEIIKHFLGNSKGFADALHNNKNPFYFDNTDTNASVYLIAPGKTGGKLSPNTNYWRVKNFGDEFFTPIKIAMHFTGLDFFPCLVEMYKHFGLAGGNSIFKAKVTHTTVSKEDKIKLGFFDIEFKKSHHDLSVIGRFVTKEIAEKYHLQSVDFYERTYIDKKTNDLKIVRVEATESYPIFAYAPDGKKWIKLYEPLAVKDEKGRSTKHGYLGEKPVRFVHGLQQIRDLYNSEIAKLEAKLKKAQKDKDEPLQNSILNQISDFQLDRVIICTGGSDGLNVASLGEHVIWFNSESEQINYEEYKELLKYCKAIYNLPDVDAAGVKYAYEVAENFWNMKTIWLPKEKLSANGKDFRDFMKFYNNASFETLKMQFSNLVIGALKMKFFERSNKTLRVKPTYLHYFLKVKGFYLYYPEKTYTDKVAEQEFMFIQIVDNVVTQVFPNDIKKYVERYLIAKGQSIEVLDLIKKTVEFNEKNLLGIDAISLDFKNYTIDSQNFFFNNLFVNVTAESIQIKPYKDYSNYVWKKSILQHNITLEKPFFSFSKDENGNNKVEILQKDSEYMNFLINTSRVCWRKELEEQFPNENDRLQYMEKNRFNLTSSYLTAKENQLQIDHFLSKCFAIGYILHKQKIQSFAKCVYVIDDKAKESEDEANGRSGKSIIFYGIDQVYPNRFLLDGKNKNLTTYNHILHGLTKENDYIYVEDLDQYVKFDFFYNWITGSITVQPKQTKQYELKFFDAPKVVITSNHGLPQITSSTQGRILFVSTSDYYHEKTDHYNEQRKVSHDFGHDLFSVSWDKKQWNLLYNFFFQCCQFYMQNIDNPILAPQSNININNAVATMGDVFLEWCESYFVETTFINVEKEEQSLSGTTKTIEKEEIKGTLNEFIPRSAMQDNYSKRAGKFSKTSANFKKSLQHYCKLKGWELNPKELCGSDGKIKQPIVDEKGKRQIVEHFFIKTNDAPIKTNEDEKESDLPF